MLQEFRKIVKLQLRQTGTNQGDFADRIGMSFQSLSRILNGKQAVPHDRAEAWATELGIAPGPERESFIDTMNVAAASPRAQAVFERERARRMLAERFRETCARNIRFARKALDRIQTGTPTLLGEIEVVDTEQRRVADGGDPAALEHQVDDDALDDDGDDVKPPEG